MPELIVEEVESGIFVVTMNRPQKLNALGLDMVDEMHCAFDDLDASRHVRAVVLTGAGRGFCSGADLTGQDFDNDDVLGDVSAHIAMQKKLSSLHEKIHRLRPPVIAAINGVAVGGGLSLSLASDIRIAACSARFGAVFITVGISGCDMGTSYLLPRLVGASRAAELMLTGRIFASAEAKDMGLVVDVVDDDRLLDRALQMCRNIAQHSPLAVWMTKETLWQNVDAPSMRNAVGVEDRTQVLCGLSGDGIEALAAFAQKRAPRWKALAQ